MSLDVMRMYNRGASLDAQVRYPLQTDHAGLEILAETKMEAITISGMYVFAALSSQRTRLKPCYRSGCC